MNTADKKPIYIILHVPKTGGTTIFNSCINNLKNDEILYLDPKNKRKSVEKREVVEKKISQLTKKQKNKYKVIFGHSAYFGIHVFFPTREPKYITFLRNPVDQVLSRYNYLRTLTENGELLKNSSRSLTFSVTKNSKLLSFNDWLQDDSLFRNISTKFLSHQFFNGHTKESDEKKLIEVKKILKKFYFIGLTENQNDFMFVFSLLKFNKFFPRQNVSKKYFIPKDYRKTKQSILAKNRVDQSLYEFALKLNKNFKEKNNNYYTTVRRAQIKKMIFLPPFFLFYYIIKNLYKISAKIKKKSRIYTKIIRILKSEF